MDFLFHVLIEPWIAILTAPLFFGEVVIGGILSGVMYSLVALGFVLIYKASGVFNFAQGVMVLFAALSLVGLMERGVPLLLAIVLTGLIMLALAFAIERVILRYMVNQEQIILFMATIGLTFFLEGFGETLWGSNVKALDIGIPDAPLNIAKVTVGTPLLAAYGISNAGDKGSTEFLEFVEKRLRRATTHPSSALSFDRGLVFCPLYVSQHGKGRIVACQWHNEPPAKLDPRNDGTFYLRCIQ